MAYRILEMGGLTQKCKKLFFIMASKKYIEVRDNLIKAIDLANEALLKYPCIKTCNRP